MVNKNYLHICYACDNHYVLPVGVSMVSVLDHLPPGSVCFWILDAGISAHNKKRFLQVTSKYAAQLHFCPVSNVLQQLAALGVRKWLNNSLATYARIFIADLLPSSVKRVIYLDGDTIVNQELLSLWQMPMKNYALAAVVEAAHQRIKISRNIPQSGNYYNAGVLMINLPMYQKQHLKNKMLEHLRSVQADYLYVDQDLINICCHPTIMRLPIKYNMTHPFLLWNRKQLQHIYHYSENFYSAQELLEAQQQPAIIHFAGEFLGRPWEKNNIHPWAYLFDDYCQQSPWNNYQQKVKKLALIIKVQRFLYQHSPRSIFVKINSWATFVNSIKYY